MKIKILFLCLLFFLFFVQCSKKKTMPDRLDNGFKTINKSGNDAVQQILSQLGAAIPTQQIKYQEARMIDLKGQKVNLSAFEGKVIILNLWATWCGPCRREMPSMEELYRQYKNDDFVLLAVSMGEEMSLVKQFIEKNGYSFPVLLDDQNSVASQYSTGSIPTTYIIDKKGYLVTRIVGSMEWNTPLIKRLVNELIEAGS